jgi:acetylornithine deacetylase/succinyl-diaminopimelate desuccinylase-like protein
MFVGQENLMTAKRLRMLFLAMLVVAGSGLIAQSNPTALAVRQWRQQHEQNIIGEYVNFLKIPNVSRDKEGIARNADFIVEMLKRRGISAKQLTVEHANPVVFGEIMTPGATRTFVFYAHYDGQPFDPKEWKSPPFTPTLRSGPLGKGGQDIPIPPAGTPFDPESRLYARGAGDDKVCVMALMAAVDALKETGGKLKSNVKFVFDGEEEIGSDHLEAIVSANKQLLKGDVWLMCDGPVHQSGRPLVYFGVRDETKLDLTVYGAKVELHSGQYGNWAPNPAMMLARLLASMKDENGHVLIDHFYDDVEPLGDLERKAIADAPDNDAELRKELWIGSTEGAPKKRLELITEPSFTIRGMASSRVGTQASNSIPSTATCSIDMRLVKGVDATTTQNRVIEHIRQQGYYVVEQPPTPEIRIAHPKVVYVDRGSTGYGGAVSTPMDLPIAQEVVRTIETVRGKVIRIPNMGATMPLASIVKPLGTHTLIVPIANYDDNQHTFDENIRIGNLWDGIEVMAALLSM